MSRYLRKARKNGSRGVAMIANSPPCARADDVALVPHRSDVKRPCSLFFGCVPVHATRVKPL